MRSSGVARLMAQAAAAWLPAARAAGAAAPQLSAGAAAPQLPQALRPAVQQLGRYFRGFAASAAGPARGAAAAAAAGASRAAPPIGGGSGGSSGSGASPFGRWWAAFQAVPTVPKVLGLAGAVPFIALAPPVAKHLTGVLPADVVDNSAMVQVAYGVTIVSFLGAVHWGVAMGSSALAGPVAARIANESFVYSVLPSLAAWPVALMEPGAGAVVLSVLLPGCLVADYTRRNLGLPHWYVYGLRVPLTLLATFGMLLTATRHLHLEFDRVEALKAASTAPPAQQQQ